jgi:hypothetical protein
MPAALIGPGSTPYGNSSSAVVPRESSPSSYYFRAMRMARLCLVGHQGRCYRSERWNVAPPVTSRSIGGVYADDAPVLCGNWICGGALDIPAAASAGSRPSYAFSVLGPFVDLLVRLGRAPRCASISSSRALSHTKGLVPRFALVISARLLFLTTICLGTRQEAGAAAFQVQWQSFQQ